MTGLRASVVIPAHNEAAVIERCLRALTVGAPANSLDVVVACNGCSDDTAALARSLSSPRWPVTVVETDTASKIVALRLGDRHATVFPRVYLDADIELSGAAVLAVADRLRTGAELAGRPPLRYLVDGASWSVRRYYTARSRVPSLMSALWGAGVYAMSEQGRSRFADWPDVVGDDLFVDRLFARDEIVIVDAEPAVVRIPTTPQSLLGILRRAQRGKHQPGGDSAEPPVAATSTLRGVVRSALGGPGAAVDAAVFVGYALAARASAARAAHGTWERDETSRVAS